MGEKGSNPMTAFVHKILHESLQKARITVTCSAVKSYQGDSVQPCCETRQQYPTMAASGPQLTLQHANIHLPALLRGALSSQEED